MIRIVNEEYFNVTSHINKKNKFQKLFYISSLSRFNASPIRLATVIQNGLGDELHANDVHLLSTKRDDKNGKNFNILLHPDREEGKYKDRLIVFAAIPYNGIVKPLQKQKGVHFYNVYYYKASKERMKIGYHNILYLTFEIEPDEVELTDGIFEYTFCTAARDEDGDTTETTHRIEIFRMDKAPSYYSLAIYSSDTYGTDPYVCDKSGFSIPLEEPVNSLLTKKKTKESA